MKTSIERHIFELLKYYDCVIITGLGGFILNYRGSYFNQITQKIYPPTKSIAFNQNLIQNDGLLANYIQDLEKISYDEACIEILKFVRKTKLNLQKGNSIVFENIGEIYYNENSKIQFQPIDSFNFNSHSYGLDSFKLNKTKKINSKDNNSRLSAAAIILLICISIISLNQNNFENILTFNLNPIKTNHYNPRTTVADIDSLGKETPGIYNVQVSKVDPDLYKINGTNYHIATKRCFKEGFARDVQIKIWIDEKNRTQRQVCFLNPAETEYDDCFKIITVYNEMKSKSNKIMVLMKNGKMKEGLLVLEETYIDPYVIVNSIPEEETDNNSDSLLVKDIPERFINAIQNLSNPEKNIDKPIKITITNSDTESELTLKTKNIHIIAGSFSEEKNAKALAKQMINRGFKNASIVGKNKNGLIRVAIESFYTEEEAQIKLIDVKSKVASAWILNDN
jgi:hypothetical protein|tara:strand:- start:4318 stop:5673 length:1356 start_codon:yes stop_codon:yes gene_type:complete